MKTQILLLALLGGFVLNSEATVSGPDNIVYGTITLGGVAVTAANTNFFVAARLQPSGPPIATYTMGSLPSAGNFYSLRISVESVGSVLAPNAVEANQVIFLDVDDHTGIRAQTSFKVGAPGQITLLNFGTASFGTSSGAVNVAILPAAAVLATAQWQVDGGSNQTSGATVTNLSAGSHTISFTSIMGWNTPSNEVVMISDGVTTMASGIYTQPNAGLTLLTNGNGTINHAGWPQSLVVGRKYRVTAAPEPNNIFVNWVGGTNQPYSVLSSAAGYSFTMQPNLLLEANFVTNAFMDAQGTYRGLFAPTSSARHQTDSGSFLFAVNSKGMVSGNLNLGGKNVPFSGKFSSAGAANITAKTARGQPSLIIALQLGFTDKAVSGMVSNASIIANLNGNRDVFSSSANATNLEGRYTIVIPGTNNSAIGPFGDSYGTVKVSPTGAITLAGSLADGTAISQSTMISQDGYWPLYINLYGGKGSLWGWNYFTNNTITNVTPISWINTTNSTKRAVYRSGFTNQAATLTGGIYTPGQTLPAGLIVTLQETNPPFTLTITNLTDNTNSLTLKTNKTTGVISGSFANPLEPDRVIKFNGVILQGQTNALGYFLGTNQSGTVSLRPQ